MSATPCPRPLNFSADFAALARVPEHSLALMTAMSGGEPFLVDRWLFFSAEDWLMAIGYPLYGKYDPREFEGALRKARERVDPEYCYAVSPELPASLKKHEAETDRFYVLAADAPVPSRLKNAVAKAAKTLIVREGDAFTPAHGRLWGEFLTRTQMTDRVRELYARTPKALKKGALKFLNAFDAEGNLVACLLLDYKPARFLSYVLGAHSKIHYAPHAADLLFARMLEKARETGKRYVHLGLGVNDGILRFKKKWGARAYYPYSFASWREERDIGAGRAFALALMRAGASSPRQILADAPSTRPFAMLWKVEKHGAVSWLAGTAHFFRYSFEPSFRKLFAQVDNVVFEGPLDEDFMNKVDAAGKKLDPGAKPLVDFMSEDEIRELEKTVYGPRGTFARLWGAEKPCRVDVRELLASSRYWRAFFSCWTAYLERLGWRESTDMEAWRVAKAMGKNVFGMESLEEQLESLDSLPLERVTRFFRDCRSWKKRAGANLGAYLAGDLEKMMGSSAEFPTRTEHIVGRRDQRFRERMRPWLETGRSAVFVGSAHLVNLRHMLKEDGFGVRQVPFGLVARAQLKARDIFRPDERVTW